MRHIPCVTSVFRYQTIVVVGAVTILVVSGTAKARSLSSLEMMLSRGTSTEVCSMSQSCDAYNTYSGKCAGQRDGTACFTCSNSSTTVNYLDQANGTCNPPAPGLKYGNGPPANVNCGNKSLNATCQGGKCTADNYTTNACSQPNSIVSQ